MTAAAGLPGLALADPGDGAAFAAMRATWNDQLTGGEVDLGNPAVAAALAAQDDVVQAYLDDIVRTPDRDRVFSDIPLVLGKPGMMVNTATQLETMAVAYRTPGSRFAGDAGVLTDVLEGIALWSERVYNADQPEVGGWWNWEIGSSRPLANICCLLYDDIPAGARDQYLAAIDHFVPDPRYYYPPDHQWHQISTGANRVWLCQAVLIRGIAGDTIERVETARDALAEAFVYAESGDGFYRDGSFVQHKVLAYTGGYGNSFLSSNVSLLAVLGGSPWDLAGEERDFLIDVLDRAYIPLVHDGAMVSTVMGRNISRSTSSEHAVGHSIAQSALVLAQIADPDTAARWRGTVKGWLERDMWRDPYENGNLIRMSLFSELLDDDSVAPTPEPPGSVMFGGMARAVHRGPDWMVAFALACTRIAFYETINGENLKGWHTGAGAMYLYDADGGQFDDAYWPTVDPYRIPGTTIDTQPLPAVVDGKNPLPKSAKWAGGAVLEGAFSAVGMNVEGLDSPLRGRKSWFCVDDYVIALGAGISGSNGDPVVTTVENRQLHTDGENALIVDGVEQPTTQGWTGQLEQVNWAHLDGVAGYIFPERVTLDAVREERTGAWRDINDGTDPDDPITRRYLTLSVDHGAKPVNSDYAYVMVPGATAARTAELAEDPDLEIITNTGDVQAARVPRLGLTAANFWLAAAAGEIQAGPGCSIVLQERGNELAVAVANPTHARTELVITINRAGYWQWTGDDTITVQELGARVVFTADVSGADGASHTVVFQRGREGGRGSRSDR